MYIGKRMKQYRKENGMTQKAFAEKVGILASKISRIERGWIAPTESQLEKILREIGKEEETNDE